MHTIEQLARKAATDVRRALAELADTASVSSADNALSKRVDSVLDRARRAMASIGGSFSGVAQATPDGKVMMDNELALTADQAMQSFVEHQKHRVEDALARSLAQLSEVWPTQA